MNSTISDKDKNAWNKFVNSNDKLPDKDCNNKKKKIYKTKSIDLHGYSLEEANKIIEDFINKSYLESVNKLIVVTGKGLHSQNEKDPFVSKDFSILKYSIPEFIKNNKELMSKIVDTKEASIEDGGSGAFYIYLKNKEKKK